MSGDLQFNKIAGAGLATVFTILVVNTIADGVYHQEAPEKMGYHVEVAEAGGGAAEAELPPDWGTVLPAADLAAGEQVGKLLVVDIHSDLIVGRGARHSSRHPRCSGRAAHP